MKIVILFKEGQSEEGFHLYNNNPMATETSNNNLINHIDEYLTNHKSDNNDSRNISISVKEELRQYPPQSQPQSQQQQVNHDSSMSKRLSDELNDSLELSSSHNPAVPGADVIESNCQRHVVNNTTKKEENLSISSKCIIIYKELNEK